MSTEQHTLATRQHEFTITDDKINEGAHLAACNELTSSHDVHPVDAPNLVGDMIQILGPAIILAFIELVVMGMDDHEHAHFNDIARDQRTQLTRRLSECSGSPSMQKSPDRLAVDFVDRPPIS